MLTVENLDLSYGPVFALQDVSLTVGAEEIVALLGANGAGKTSLLRSISGLESPQSGAVRFRDQSILGMPPHRITGLRIAHCPEGRRIFPELTVQENLDLGAYLCETPRRAAANLERVFHYFPRLTERRNQKGGSLSGGEQQMLAVARALMNNPTLLMLDEPSLGLAPMIMDQIFHIIRDVNRDEGVTIFLVEQNANEALHYAHRAYILENGRITLQGGAEELRNDPKVREAYLGV